MGNDEELKTKNDEKKKRVRRQIVEAKLFPQDPPPGCFWVTEGRPANPADIARIQAFGPERCLQLLFDQKIGEQSRYKLLRCFFPLSFREYRLLEKRARGNAET